MHGFDKAARDGKTKAGAGANVIALLGAIELVEYAIELDRWNPAALIEDLQRDRIAIPRTPDRYRGIGRRVFRSIVQQVEQHLLEQHGVELQHRQVGGKLQRHLVMHENFSRAPQRAADDLADVM